MFDRTFVKTGILLSFLVLGAAAQAADEVIAVKGGTFLYENDTGLLDIFGNKNFTLQGRISRHEGRFDLVTNCEDDQCTPGAEIEIGALWSGLAFSRTIAMLRGKTYPDVGGMNSPNAAEVAFSGTVIFPEITGPIEISAPFNFGGTFHYGSEDGRVSGDAILTGAGSVTLFLEPALDGLSWRIRRAEFHFAK